MTTKDRQLLVARLAEDLNQISQALYHEGEKLFKSGSIDASRVMFAAMMSAGAAALLDLNSSSNLQELLDSIGEVIDQINVARIKLASDHGLN